MEGENQYDEMATAGTSAASVATDNATGSIFSSANMDVDYYGPEYCPGDEMNNTDCPYQLVNAWHSYSMNAYTVVVSGYLSPALVVFTLLTNTLVCVVLLKKNMRTPTNTMLVAMAIADMLTGIWPIPCFVFFYSLGHWEEWVPYDWCFVYDVLCEYLPTTFHTASIWLTVALAVQRYICVCHSLKAKQWCTIPNVLKVIAGIYIASMASQSIRFMEKVYIRADLDSLVNTNQTNTTVVGCAYRFSSFVEDHQMVYFNTYYWFRVIFMSFVPCISLVFLNALLVNAMRNAQARRHILLKQNRNTESKRLKESNCTTMMLVVVVGVFLLVEIPVAICIIIQIIENNMGIGIMSRDGSSAAGLFINLFILLSYPINFFIYCGMSRQFRETFKRLFQPGPAPLDREHSQYMSLLENGGKTLNTHETVI